MKTSPGQPREDSAGTLTDPLPEHPRLAHDVEVHPPERPEAPWVLRQGERRYIRVGADMAKLLRALDGTRDHAALAETLGPPWSVADVRAVVGQVHRMGLVDDGAADPPRQSGVRRRRLSRIKIIPPLTVQFTVLRPERFMTLIRPLIMALANRFSAAVALALGVGGLPALAAQSADLDRALGQPLPLGVYAAVLLASFATTALHEIGHGVTLTYHGGRPSRMGVMLFYLAPAFFCEVTDGWRLPSRAQRVQVALAGAAVQAMMAGLAAIVALFAGTPDVHHAVLMFALSTYIGAAFNLLPLVKFDGYIALMSHLDIPYLRDKAMADARRFLARVLFGGGRYTREIDRPWSVPYGLACLVFPLYLVATAMSLWLDTLHGLGIFGIALLVAASLYLLYRLGAGFRKLMAEARAAGAHPVRLWAATTSVLLAIAAVLTFAEVPYTVPGAYVRSDDGRVELVLPLKADHAAIAPDAEVLLLRRGLLLRTPTGSAVVAGAQAVETTAPVSAFLPLRLEHPLTMPVKSYPLRVRQAPETAVGAAEIEAGRVALGTLLYRTFFVPALQ